VTCLAVGGPGSRLVFGGCWDKNIWSWNIASGQPDRKYVGHSDFVKALVCCRLQDQDVLISGGSDKKIIVWNIETGARIHVLQDPSTTMMAVQDLVIDPILTTPNEVVVVSASSDPHIRRWQITVDGYRQLEEAHPDQPSTERLTIQEHETSVYKLRFDLLDDEADLWTASADGTAKRFARSRKFVADDVFEHGDFVRGVIATPQWVFTAGRDEDIKVWDKASGKLYCTLEGHYDEITDMALLLARNGIPKSIVTVSVDRTLRVWPIQQTQIDNLVQEIQASKDSREEVKEEEKASNSMTAEEEAELAALMEDDD
jgi:WD40 repeat protein